MKFLKRTLGMKAFHECVETLRRDGGMSKDTGELIKKKSINLCCQPIFSYISSLIIVPNAPFSQSLSHMLLFCEFCMHVQKLHPARERLRNDS